MASRFRRFKVRQPIHAAGGNCWRYAYNCRTDGCRPGDLCDVCHKHSSPRGECDSCPRCAPCDAEQSESAETFEAKHS